MDEEQWRNSVTSVSNSHRERERERGEEGAEDIATLMQSTSAESELWPGIRLHTSHLHIPVTRPLKTHTHIRSHRS